MVVCHIGWNNRAQFTTTTIVMPRFKKPFKRRLILSHTSRPSSKAKAIFTSVICRVTHTITSDFLHTWDHFHLGFVTMPARAWKRNLYRRNEGSRYQALLLPSIPLDQPLLPEKMLDYFVSSIHQKLIKTIPKTVATIISPVVSMPRANPIRPGIITFLIIPARLDL